MQFQYVLFPFDYSDRCRRAAPFVKSLIEKTGARLAMLNVIEDPSAHYPASAAFLVPPSERDELLTASTRFLRTYADQTFPGCAVDAVCKMGDPAKEIIRFTSEAQVDLIMMPTRGGGQFRRLLLGSVTAKVLDDAKCPVWTDAHMDQNEQMVELSTRNILCAVDDKEESVSIIRCASNVASLYSATLRLVHVTPELDPSLKLLRPEWARDFQESARAKITALRDKAGVTAEFCVQEGAASTVIRQAALGCKADLVVIGRGHLQGFLGRLRTRAYAIIRDSPCPVLSV